MYVYIYPHTHTEGETCIPESVYGVEFMLYLKFYISLFYYFYAGIIHPHQETDYSPIISYRFKNIFLFMFTFLICLR